MPSRVVASEDFLQSFMMWGDKKRTAFLNEPLIPHRGLDEDVNQSVVVREDLKRCIYSFFAHSKYEVASIAQRIVTIAISPFAVIAELYRLCTGSINAFACLRNICIIPKHIIFSIFDSVFCIVRDANKTVNAVSTGVGFLAWHGGESIVRLIKGSSHTVLSNDPEVRDIVYDSLGITLLTAATAFVPVAPIQLVSLPIILGSLYGTLNNQFTVRECPEYYTMGHYYDGTNLKGHAIKTNNVLIKPIVTGCYATTFVTKIAGVILAAVGTLPYTAATLPVSYAATMIAGVTLVSLVVAHIFSTMAKKSIQENLKAYGDLIGIQWTNDNRNKAWYELFEIQEQGIEKKRKELASNEQELKKFEKKLQELAKAIKSSISDLSMPVKYIEGWKANSTRNGVGYLFAGGGTLVLTISTIFLRIYAL